MKTVWHDPEEPAPGGRDQFHVAINMDGNGRWALLRGQPRVAGHVAGVRLIREQKVHAPPIVRYGVLSKGFSNQRF